MIVGVGALGQMAAETCVRSGYCHLVLIDGDSFTYSNFNRQLYANVETIGKPKVDVAEQALLRIRPDLEISTLKNFLGPERGADIIPEESIILDCTDDIPSKIYLEELAGEKNLPLIHGAVDGWYGQMAAIFPEDGILRRIYQEHERNHTGRTSDALMLTVNIIASMQVRALIGITLGETEHLRKKITFIDMNQNEIQTVPVSG